MSVARVGSGIALQFLGALFFLGGIGSCTYGLGFAEGTNQVPFLGLTLLLMVLGLATLVIGGKQLRGTPLSVGDKPPDEAKSEPGKCKEADDALTYGIIGIFCFGVILGPVAILKALRAKRLIAANPGLEGAGKATAGLVLGSAACLVWFVGIAVQVGRPMFFERRMAILPLTESPTAPVAAQADVAAESVAAARGAPPRAEPEPTPVRPRLPAPKAPVAAGAQAPTAPPLVLGRQRLAAADPEGAVAYYEKACGAGSADGCFGLTNYLTGRAFESATGERSRYVEPGLAAAERALELDPSNFETLIYQGVLYGYQAESAANRESRRELWAKRTELGARARELREQGGHRGRGEDRFWEPPPPPPPPVRAPGGAASPAPVRVGGQIKPPRKVKDVPAIYPETARQARVQGIVIIECLISPSGEVTDARVLRGIPSLDQAAIDAVEQWSFEPTLVGGAAVPVLMTVTVSFKLN